jgi:hypothetical protein
MEKVSKRAVSPSAALTPLRVRVCALVPPPQARDAQARASAARDSLSTPAGGGGDAVEPPPALVAVDAPPPAPVEGAAAAPPLPEGWETAVSRSTGDVYYVNQLTGESTYDFPTGPATDETGMGTPMGSDAAGAGEEEQGAAMEGRRESTGMNLRAVGQGLAARATAAASATASATKKAAGKARESDTAAKVGARGARAVCAWAGWLGVLCALCQHAEADCVAVAAGTRAWLRSGFVRVRGGRCENVPRPQRAGARNAVCGRRCSLSLSLSLSLSACAPPPPPTRPLLNEAALTQPTAAAAAGSPTPRRRGAVPPGKCALAAAATAAAVPPWKTAHARRCLNGQPRWLRQEQDRHSSRGHGRQQGGWRR